MTIIHTHTHKLMIYWRDCYLGESYDHIKEFSIADTQYQGYNIHTQNTVNL